MCNTGGPRCEYSGRWLLEKRRVQRTKKYKEAHSSEQERILWQCKNDFQKANSKEFKEHLPTREKWQTKARPLPRRRAEALAKTFPKPRTISSEEGTMLAERMNEEATGFREALSEEDAHSLNIYTMTAHSDINGYLRRGPKGIEESYMGEERLDFIKSHAENLKRVVGDYPKASEDRVLYRHMLIPAGISPREFANKYFKVGERVRDSGFLSTTEDPAYIAGHAFSRRPSEYVVMQILSKQGVSVQPSERERVGHLQSWEKERLLPAGANFRVVGVRRETLEIDLAREQMHQQFRSRTGYYSDPIPPKNFTIVQLVDETSLED